MMAWLGPLAGGAAALAAGVVAAGTLSFRHRWRPGLDAIRRFNRSVINPRRLRTAGRAGDPATVVHHAGRRTRTAYRTPVGTVVTADGFVFALPYGPGADWVRNVLAAGGAILERDGGRTAVDRPELVDAAVADPFFPPPLRRVHRFFGIDTFLRVRRVPEA